MGNALEVLEALAVLAPAPPPGWDRRALDEQRGLVVRFFALLLSRTFPDASYDDCRALGAERLASGRALASFLELLAAHGVGAATREALLRDPWPVAGPRGDPLPVRAERSGRLRRVDQHRLGFVVNFALGGGGNEYGGAFDPRAGVLLRKRLGDPVAAGEELCTAYLGERTDRAGLVLADLGGCFDVGP